VNPRQYYLARRYESWLGGDVTLADVWRTKQHAEPGTALPASLPLAKLAFPAIGLADDELVDGAEWYTTHEDLEGYGSDQLQYLGLTADEAAAVCAALEEFYA